MMIGAYKIWLTLPFINSLMRTAIVTHGLKCPPETYPNIIIAAKRVRAIAPASGPLQLKAMTSKAVPIASYTSTGISVPLFHAVYNGNGTLCPFDS